MLLLLGLTKILPTPLIGMIVMGLILDASALWSTCLIILIVDAIVGITLQTIVDRAVQKESNDLLRAIDWMKQQLNDEAEKEATHKCVEEEEAEECEFEAEEAEGADSEELVCDHFAEEDTDGTYPPVNGERQCADEGEAREETCPWLLEYEPGRFFALEQRILPGFHFDTFFTSNEYKETLYKDAMGAPLSTDEKCMIILPLIFGSFDATGDLGLAEMTLDRLFGEAGKQEPPKPKDADGGERVHEYAVANMLKATLFVYQKRLVAAAYHFMRGLKSEGLSINRPWCKFIHSVLGKVMPLATDTACYTGCGFSTDEPMGALGGTCMIAQNAPILIADLEGDNGEVTLAFAGNTGFFGRCERIGSCTSTSTKNMIDKYETYVIDGEYNIKKVYFYLNNYYDPAHLQIKAASGFRFRAQSSIFNTNIHVL